MKIPHDCPRIIWSLVLAGFVIITLVLVFPLHVRTAAADESQTPINTERKPLQKKTTSGEDQAERGVSIVKPSSACINPSERSQKLICSDENLSYLDTLVSEQYQRMLSSIGKAKKWKLKDDQWTWHADRELIIDKVSDPVIAINILKIYTAERLRSLFERDLRENEHFRDQLPEANCEPVERICKSQKLTPKACFQVSKDQYIVQVISAGQAEQGLYFLNLPQNTIEQIQNGLPEIEGTYDSRHIIWLLTRVGHLDHGIMSGSYYAVVMAPNKSKVDFHSYRLADFEEEAEYGWCGNYPEKGESLGLSNARVVESFDIMKVGNDGKEGIVFLVKQMDCKSQTIRYVAKTYVYDNGKFVEFK
jgi:uncharacterized protein YecT (DUF1311 family)